MKRGQQVLECQTRVWVVRAMNDTLECPDDRKYPGQRLLWPR